jgi:RimJ/RimL family protein N-acetyltransferase
MFPAHVETERLHLRRFDEVVDLQTAHEHFGRDPTVEEELRYITHDPHDTLKETHDEFAEMADDWADGERAAYAILPKEGEAAPGAGDVPQTAAGPLAGDAVLMPQWDRRAAYFGVRIRKPYWGRGYSGERAAALLALTFDHLDLELTSAACHPENEQSERAIEKYVERFGGTYEGRLRNWVPMDGEVADMKRYSVSRAEYEEHREQAAGVTVHA